VTEAIMKVDFLWGLIRYLTVSLKILRQSKSRRIYSVYYGSYQ